MTRLTITTVLLTLFTIQSLFAATYGENSQLMVTDVPIYYATNLEASCYKINTRDQEKLTELTKLHTKQSSDTAYFWETSNCIKDTITLETQASSGNQKTSLKCNGIAPNEYEFGSLADNDACAVLKQTIE